MKRYRVTFKTWSSASVEVDAPDDYTAGVIASQLELANSPRIRSDGGGFGSSAAELTDPEEWEDPEEYGVGDPSNNPCSE